MDVPELGWGAATDRGQRQENQDRYLVAPPVFAVADGIGGHVGGAQASELAVTRLAEVVQGPTVSMETIRTALEQADKDIMTLGADVDPLSKPGTTVAGLTMTEHRGRGLLAGLPRRRLADPPVVEPGERPRADRGQRPLVVQALVDAGAITAERATTHPQRHMMTKALGFGDRGGAQLPVPTGRRRRPLPHVLHGLTGELTDERIGEVLASEADDQAVAEQLVAEAVRVGAQDNVSVVVARV